MANSNTYDLAIIGGGIAGSSLAKCMAESGARVLLLEAAQQFKDRVRGEVLVCWGVAEAKSLGLDDALSKAGAHKLRWCNNYLGAMQTERRDLPASTPASSPVITFYHPAMQEGILQAAESAGADVKRGVDASLVTTGFPAELHWNDGVRSAKAEARLVVIADGRNSPLRRSLGFEVKKETHTGCVAGIIFDNVSLADDTLYWFINPALGEAIGWAPEGGSRVRTYLCYWGDRKPRYQGPPDVPKILADFAWTGMAAEYFSKAQPAGPLATFDGADTWVDQPYKGGVALLGDTAASNDPTWGQGLSIALRGARTLRDSLLRNQDWHKAGEEYALEFRRWYGITRTVTGWFRELYLETGEIPDARRARAFPLFAEDPTRVPDLIFGGPDISLHRASKTRFFGEDIRGAAVSA